jgi:DNA polymerase I-like protein with 3'-5' exonuclease and polymerase domains
VFIDADYNALELYSLAQACLDMFGASELAEVLKSGKDPHTALAGDLLGISYEEAAKRKKDKKDKEFDNARQTGKVGNFGLPGGLGADKLVLFARKTYDVVLTREKAVELKKQWFARWPEMRPYFEYWTRETATVDGRGSVVLPRSNRVRGGLRFTECCNTRFQGPASDAAKEAGWLIAKACYVEEDSVLFGSRPVAFIHDQWLIETPDNDKAHDAAQETVRLMKLGASKYLPDMVPPVEPLLCRYWSKEAAPVLKEDGRLGVWP